MKKLQQLVLLFAMFLLLGCFTQTDIITFYKSGKVELIATIEITDDDATKDKVKEEVEERVKNLKKEGWKVSYKWKKRSKPYKLEFTATNTLKRIHNYNVETEGENPSGIYIYKNFDDEQFVFDIDLLENCESRTITLGKNSLPLYTVEDNKRKRVYNIESEETYYVFLE